MKEGISYAIFKAIGVLIRDLPLTLEKILESLKENQEEKTVR